MGSISKINHIRKVFFLLSVSILFIAKFGYSYNLAPYLHLKIRGEFNSPFFWEAGNRINFYKGWTRIPLKPVAIRLSSDYRFFSYGEKPVQLYILLRKNTSLVKKLKIGLYLNNHFFRKLSLERLKDFTLFFPKYLLKKGMNNLRFKIESDLGKGTRTKLADREEFIFSLEKIEFLNFPLKTEKYVNLLKKEKTFIQPPKTFFEISVNPNSDRSIDLLLHVKNSKGNGDLLIVEKEMEGTDPQTFDALELKNGMVRKKLFFKDTADGKIFNLVFRYSSPSKESYIVWDRLSVSSIKKPIRTKSSSLNHGNRPNIFLILMDALRADIIGKQVSGKYVTPNLNRFFRNSVVHNNYFVNAPYTYPSVATLLTGLLPETHTVRAWDTDLPKQIKTLPAYLKKIGYKSFALIGNPMISDLKITRDFNKVINIRNPDKGTIEFCESSYNNLNKTLSFLNTINYEIPSFVYVHFLPPHLPYIPPGDRFKIFSGSSERLISPKKGFNLYDPGFLNHFYLRYLDNAYYADYLVGKVLNLIKRKNLYNKSIIIVASDHGEAFGEHGLTEHGLSNYKEMIHVPFAIKLPGKNKFVKIEKLNSSVDFLPSIISHLGLRSIPFLKGQTDLFNLNFKKKYKNETIYSRAAGDEYNSAIFNRSFKFIFNSGFTELYDLKNDPEEKNNLSEANPLLTSYYSQAVFKYEWKNLALKNILKINKNYRKIDEKKKRVLKSLGYL